MFEYFSDKSIKVVMLAQEEANQSRQSVIGSEFLLLALLEEGTSTAAQILSDRQLTVARIRQVIEQISGRKSKGKTANLPFSSRTKQIFEEALGIFRQLNHSAVTPEHILLAILSHPESLAAKILMQQGIEPLSLRNFLLNELNQEPVGVGSSSPDNAAWGSSFASPSSKSALADFSIDLTKQARDGHLDPMIGRSQELERTLQILVRRTKNNPVLVGEPGVGKTAIAEGLAQRIVSGDIPEPLQNKRVISLDMGAILAGTRMRGDFEERLKSIISEVQKAGDIILVIDELHTLIGAGAISGAMDAANLLKPALARGELQCLGTTTVDEYRKYIEQDAALARRFQAVKVGEPSVDEAIAILQGLRKEYETFHKVKYADAALKAAVEMADRYISDRFLPDKAIDLIDEAGSRSHIRHSMTSQPDSDAILNPQCLVPVIEVDEIADIVAAWTGVPVNNLNESDTESLVYLEARIQERVIGQEAAVQAVARATRRARVGLKAAKRPIASFIFAGPTGVGKTELAKTLAACLMGSEEAMIRFDMSEYMESHTVSKLIGSPPGFIGYDEGGQLTEAVRRKPYAVLLFDEIEKAHPDVFNLFLQLLDEGRLTDAKGREVDFSNTLIILTSNLGSKAIEKGGLGLGFSFAGENQDNEYAYLHRLVSEELKQFFRPEFLNRLDEIVVFRPLLPKQLAQIADLLIETAVAQLREQRQIELSVTPAFRDKVIKEGYEPRYGARPLRRCITRLLEDSLAEAILSGQVQDGDRIVLDVDSHDGVVVMPLSIPTLALEVVRS
jgi:ATP-dependent Clp protease ATP-binding subunit ClpC